VSSSSFGSAAAAAAADSQEIRAQLEAERRAHAVTKDSLRREEEANAALRAQLNAMQQALKKYQNLSLCLDDIAARLGDARSSYGYK
jgi:uncharacterized protein YlxW (UPF0749 family)